VAVVLVRGGAVVQGYAEIVPPRGMSAADAANLVQIRVSGTGPIPKVDVIVPPGWGPQPIDPTAPVQVKDTRQAESDDAAAQRKAKVEEMRNLYRQYLNDFEFQREKFGKDLLGVTGAFGGPADTKSDDEILALPADNFFFEWLQRRQANSEWQSFQARARAMGYDDPEGIKQLWQQYRQPEFQARQQGDKQLHDLKSDPTNALQQRYAAPLLLSWMASQPKPVDVPGGDGKGKAYVLPLPDGTLVTLDDAQFAKVRKAAADEIETRLNTLQTQKDRYQFHKADRGEVSKAMDYAYGAELQGKSWGAIDEAIQAGRAALAAGDLKASLAHIEQAEKLSGGARKEWERYLHHREVGAEATILALEGVKTTTEIVLAVGTLPLGGTGLVIVTGKGVTESLVLAAAQQAGGQRVDWKDVGFDVGVQVVSGLAMHGFGKLQALGPQNAIMKAFRESFGAQLAADAVQTVLIDSATYAARQAYHEARGRNVKFTAQDFLAHLQKYLTDPTGLPLEIVKSALLRHIAGRLPAHGADPAAIKEVAPEHPQAGHDSADGAKAPPPAHGTADPAAGGGQAVKSPPVEEAHQIRELAQDKKNVHEVTDETLVKDYDVEIPIQSGGEQHTYRRKRSDGSWCRFSTRSCGFKLSPETEALVKKAEPATTPGDPPAAAKAKEPPKAIGADPAERASAASADAPKEAPAPKDAPPAKEVKAVDPEGVTAASPPDPVREANLAKLEARKNGLEAEVGEVRGKLDRLDTHLNELKKLTDPAARRAYLEKIRPELELMADFPDGPIAPRQALEAIQKEQRELGTGVLKEKLAELDAVSEALAPKEGLRHRANTTHPISGVRYDAQGFPVFDAVGRVDLPPGLYQAVDNTQFRFCNQKLARDAASNRDLERKFTPAQLAQMERGDNPDGYTWHHHQDKGRMELVATAQHDPTPHVGGGSIWGGRTERRLASKERKKERDARDAKP
jgi:hypothetical protein